MPWAMQRLVMMLVVLAGFAACGASANQRTVKAALVSTNAARDGWVEFDAKRQASIIEGATSYEDGRAKLDAYRSAHQIPIQALFVAVYQAIAVALEAKADEKTTKAVLKAAAALKEKLDAVINPQQEQ